MDASGGWQLFLAAREEADAGHYRSALEKSALALEDASLSGADRAFIRNARGTMYRSLGEAEQATAEDYLAYRAATGEDKARMYGAYLFSRHYHETDSRALAGAIHAYGRLFRRVPCHVHDRELHRAHEKIRIGYISPDFRKHIVASFMHSFFEAYDRESFEVYGYALCGENPVLETFAANADAFRILADLSPKEAARAIYADEIDILFDLSGHTAGGALPILARKPAPIQITGIGWFNTTGLSAVDYVLGDVHLDPEGEESYFVERILRLPHSHLCYAPAKSCDIGTLPAERNGYVTFGSLNAFSKVTDEALCTWAAILDEVPGARLFLKADIFDSEDGRTCVRERLQAAGIDVGRVTFEGRTENYLEAYNAIDIALDTFPYPGGGTTCDALYMGVPVVTLAGDRHGSRFGKSLLENVRLPELVASSAAEYIKIAVRLTRDTAWLKELRENLRQTMEASHIMDAKLYMREVEQAYREILARWLDGEANPQVQGKDVFREGQALYDNGDWTGLYRLFHSAVRAMEGGSRAFGEDAARVYQECAHAAQELGRTGEAVDGYRTAARLAAELPRRAELYSSALLAMHDADLEEEELYTAHQEYQRLLADIHPLPPVPVSCRETRAKIRIGYLSPDFRHHVMFPFIYAMLHGYDRERFEVHCFSLVEREDRHTEVLKDLVDGWHRVVDMPYEEMARRIRESGIEILVDLAGHSAGNALPVLAYRPAPVQVSGLGYVDTTGMETVDYLLTDGIVDPIGAHEPYFTERLVRLTSQFCYVGRNDVSASEGAPCKARGYVQFACYGGFHKLNEETLRTYQRILDRVPTARLLFKNGALSHASVRAYFHERLEKAGMPMARIELEPASSDYMDTLLDVDILLDTYPWVGGGTTFDALYMGVPVITRYGARHGSRFGLSILTQAGLEDLAAPDASSFVEKAVALAGDTELLDMLHCSLRTMLRASSAMDVKRYMRELEDFYIQATRRGQT